MKLFERITDWINFSCIRDMYSPELEKELASEYLSIMYDYTGEIIEIERLAKAYVGSSKVFHFMYNSVDEIYYLIGKHLPEVIKGKSSYDTLYREVEKYLKNHTTLSNAVIGLVTTSYLELGYLL